MRIGLINDKNRFVFTPSSNGSFKVALKLGRVESLREAWDIPEGYFFAGKKLCRNNVVAANVLFRVLVLSLLLGDGALAGPQARQPNPTQLQKPRPNLQQRRSHPTRLAS
jgi:hypothetical protein